MRNLAVNSSEQKIFDDMKNSMDDISVKMYRDYQVTTRSDALALKKLYEGRDDEVAIIAKKLDSVLDNTNFAERHQMLLDMEMAIAGLSDVAENREKDELISIYYRHLYSTEIVENMSMFIDKTTEDGFASHDTYDQFNTWLDSIKRSNKISLLLVYVSPELQDDLGNLIGYGEEFYELADINNTLEMVKNKKVAKELGIDLNSLKKRQKEQEVKIAKKNKVDSSVLSTSWVNRKAKELITPKEEGVRKSGYLELDEHEVPIINSAGIDEVNIMIKDCIQNEELRGELTQEQLVLFSMYFGIDIIKNVYDRYGLKGDATVDHPVTYDNLRAMIIGVGSTYNMDDLKTMPPEAADSLNQILEASLDSEKLGLPLRVLRDFDKRKQNKIPIYSLPWYKQLGVYLGAIADKLAGVVMRKTLEKYADSISAGNGQTISAAIFTVTAFENKANKNFLNDVQFLSAQAQARNFSNDEAGEHKTPEIMAADILKKLNHVQKLDDFFTSYPVFKSSSTESEMVKISEYFSKQEHSVDELEQVKSIIANKVSDVLLTGRAEYMAHNLSYKDQYQRDGHIVCLPRRSGEMCDFEVKGVIRDEDGLGVGLYTPVKGLEIEGDTIPLIINMPGTHSIEGVVRDLHPISAGLDEFSPNHPKNYRQTIVRELNHKIAELNRLYPGKKIEIETFGHSLGGGDSYNMDLIILEAMAQNKYNKDKREMDGGDPLEQINAAYKSSKNTNIQEHYEDALMTCLGEKDRRFGMGYNENRKYNEGDISSINTDNICLVSRCSDRGAGMTQEVADARHAATAYLCSDTDFKKAEMNLHVNGDLLKYTTKSQGMMDADPSDPLFAGKVDAKYVETDMETNRWLWGYLEHEQVAPVESHVITRSLSLEHGMAAKHTIITNSSPDSFAKMKEAMSNNIKIPFTDVTIAECTAYRALKYAAYKSVGLINKLFNLVVSPFQGIRRALSDVLRPECYRGDLREDAMDLSEEILNREHLRAQQILRSEPSEVRNSHQAEIPPHERSLDLDKTPSAERGIAPPRAGG
ncbi:MAG: hypothetical protein HON32_08390 [Francisellaceae bacterium]|jgi:hypothetical protein|nr:hypothetical protein [Francisellaceae bacterium]MBT6538087.1 hypothetical protein [Francisellaceae bacterium]